MFTDDEAKMIAEYERLRRKLDELDREAERVDARLIELDRLLPDDYDYPPDHPNAETRPGPAWHKS